MHSALTIDVEDWYHPELVRGRVPPGRRDAQIEESTEQLLQLLQKHDVRATFFVVGEVARQHPELVVKIAAQGHEVGCHSMTHRPLWEMTPDELRAELDEFRATMQQILPGVQVAGFRAPTFSLDNRTAWALDVLADCGYLYDSSIFPVRNPVYGVSGAPLVPYRPSVADVSLADPCGRIVEFPMSVWTCGGLRAPVSGGFYLRALPFQLLMRALRQVASQRPLVVYVHPWEACVRTPRLSLPLLSRFVTYYNLSGVTSRLAAILDSFQFAPMRSVLSELGVC